MSYEKQTWQTGDVITATNFDGNHYCVVPYYDDAYSTNAVDGYPRLIWE